MGRSYALLLSTMLTAVPALAVSAVRADLDDATSPDGRWQVAVHSELGEPAANGDRPTSLWLIDTRAHTRRLLLLRGASSSDPRHDLTSVHRPRFSLDGSYIYVEASAYATSPAIHQIQVRSGRERYVADGALLGVLRSGPWRGFLVVQQHRYAAQGGSHEANIVFLPDGRRMASIPGTGDEAAQAWLARKGWQIS